ncbi:MAG TPA: threonine/serine dehydratase [Acidimicrobiia bacterium]|nr:threonine/serine dehydratase [Acidimicrobiia bacterium]
MEITREQIAAAAGRIEGLVRATPIVEVEPGLVLKLDLLQPTGSFKVRGAFSFLTAHPGAERVVAASGGNFGLAVAYAADRLGMQADIFVPSTSPEAKVDRIRRLGAELHVVDGYYAAALEAARRFLDDHDGLEAHAFDQTDVVAGQGTCGQEILTQIPDVDAVVVAVGGAGLIGGVASWIRNDARVIGAETHGTQALHAALGAGHPVTVEVGGVAADSLGASRVGDIGFDAARRWVDESVLVEDDDVIAAQRWLWDECRLVAEPGAATPLAAVLTGAYRRRRGEKVCVLVSGANTQPASVT